MRFVKIGMRKAILIILLFAMSAVVVQAETFSVGIDKAAVYKAGVDSEFSLEVTNNGADDWFSVSFFGFPPDWVVAEGLSMRIASGQTGTLKIYFEPTRDASPGTYKYTIFVNRISTGEQVEEDILLEVTQQSIAVVKDLDVSCSLCSGSVDVSGYIENLATNPLDTTLTLSIGNEKRTINTFVDFNSRELFEENVPLRGLDPGTYTLAVEIAANGKAVYTDSREITVRESGTVKYDEDISSNPFGRFVTIVAYNEGNTEADATLTSEVPLVWYTIFSGPDPATKDGALYQWSLTLKPGETTKVSYSLFYWPTFVFILLGALAAFYYYLQLMSFGIEKSIRGGDMVQLGQEMSVSIRLQNKLREVEDMVITDLIPNRFAVVPKFETAKPLIKKSSHGTELIWKLPGLKSREERFLHYKIKPVESFVASHLPPAIVKAKSNGNAIERVSNVVHIRGHPEESKTLRVRISK